MELEILETPEDVERLEHTPDDGFSETEYEDVGEFMQPEIRNDVPGVETAIVSGDPEGVAQILDCIQGDAVEGAEGTCGLTSIANICRLAGMDVTEGEVVTFALENDLCHYDPWHPEHTGGVGDAAAVEILNDYGIDVGCYDANSYDVEMLAQAIESGRGVMAGVDAGALWDNPSHTNSISGHRIANHFVTMTGVARDAETGQVAGFYICDSGDGEACRYITVEDFHEVCGADDIETDNYLITDEPIRRS